MDAEERRLFADSVRDLMSAGAGGRVGAPLNELGWLDALAEDAEAAVSEVFESQGTHNVSSAALDDLLATALGHQSPVSVVLPELGRVDSPGVGSGGQIAVRGLTTASNRERMLVVVREGTVECAVEIGPVGGSLIHGIDPELGLSSLEATLDVDATTGSPVDWPAALALGQVAVGYELLGASRAMIRLARQHAVERVQFDRPIAGFQAVRHRLAEAHVAAESTSASLQAYWVMPTTQTATVVKAIAGRNARLVARHAQQVLAGIGFTVEHPLHRYVRRVLVLDGLLGSARLLTRQLGEDVLSRRQLPDPVPL